MLPFAEKDTLARQAADAAAQMVKDLAALPSLPLESFAPGQTMLLVVDMNKGFAQAGSLYSPRVQALVPGIAALLDAAIARRFALLAYSDCHTPASPELSAYPAHCMQGSEEPQLVEQLGRLEHFVVHKNCTNGLLAGGGLPRPEISSYIITGCCTDICIYQLATSLKATLNERNQSARVIVPMALVDTYDAPGHPADLANLASLAGLLAAGVEVVQDITL